MTEIKLPPLPEPDSYLFQHEETGLSQYVDSQQVEWGFEKANPRWQKIHGAFTERQLRAYATAAIEAYQAGRAALQSQDKEDAERLDWLEEQAQSSRTGASIDYVYDAEDGYVNEKGYRFWKHRFMGPLGKTAREAIDHARRIEGATKRTKTNEPDLAQGKTMENITTVTPVDHNLTDPTQADLADPMFEAIWQVIKKWDLSRDGGIGASYAGATGTDVMTVLIPVRQTLVDWAVDQWRKQVESRPLDNMHRRSLDDVWRQVIRRMGADDVSLIGPTHDELLKEMK